jgi:hypothetical protein
VIVRQISVVAIATADRPARLRRVLASLDAAAVPEGRAVRVVIVDGSRSRANRLATRACVERAAARSERLMQYISPEDARSLRHSLGVRGSLSRALSPGATGANRNLLVLLTAGEHVLFVDDDVVAETKTMGSRKRGLVLAGHDEHRECRFATSRRAALAAVQPAQIPLIAAHEELLGLTVRELVVASAGHVDVRGACPHLIPGLAGGRQLSVRLTFAGVVGDSGTYCPKRLLLSTGGTLRRTLWDSERAFDTAMRHREVVRIAPVNAVTHEANCMAMCMGLANDTMSPPFPPLGRNEDGVFGALTAAVDLGAVYGHLSVGVRHDSLRPSRYRSDEVRSARESRLSELIINIVRHATPSIGVTSPDRRLQGIGRVLHDVASLPPGAFVRYVRDITNDTRTREFDLAAMATRQDACPVYWQRALVSYRKAWEKAAMSEAFFLPVEFHGLRSTASGYRALQGELTRFGDLLASWPELWRRARLANGHGGTPVPPMRGARTGASEEP